MFFYSSRETESDRETEIKREKEDAGSNTEHKKREKIKQIIPAKREIKHSADGPHYTEKRDFDWGWETGTKGGKTKKPDR